MSPDSGPSPQTQISSAMAQVQAPPPPPMFGWNQMPKRKQGQSFTPTFLGTGSIPTAPQLGKATLLGAA